MMRKLWPLMVLVVTSACLSDTSGSPTGSSTTVTAAAVDRITVCDRAQGGCVQNAVVALNSTAVDVRATAYSATAADLTTTCVFAWTPLVPNLLTIKTSSDASKRDALITRVGAGAVSVLVTCGSAVGVFTVN